MLVRACSSASLTSPSILSLPTIPLQTETSELILITTRTDSSGLNRRFLSLITRLKLKPRMPAIGIRFAISLLSQENTEPLFSSFSPPAAGPVLEANLSRWPHRRRSHAGATPPQAVSGEPEPRRLNLRARSRASMR
ncbi:hypothetical protein BRADI_5g09705v3 [Brachypodium distachyon]|uniref:Uncharacterized protein n=1 Tax=Brachypodium distachyon TaxID=15368 RepID=A0A2K2CG96_BRADI|nr:hypothetical protein BRADI_5g09705v3 [Brachypodium distachyon]